MKKIKSFISVLLCTAVFLTGCKSNVKTQYKIPENMKTVPSGIAAENSKLALSWDDDMKCALLTDKATGYIWATTPYDFYNSGQTSYNLSSPVILEYYNPDDNSTQIAQGFECIENGTVSSQKTENGIKAYFYFKEVEITVAVTYTLRAESLEISVNTDDIQESGKSKLISISLAPYFCSVKNSADKNSYLFVPSGSGALMYTDDEPDKESRDYSGEVYGYDLSRAKLDHPGDGEAVRLPVFGASNGREAMLGIIESGDGAATVSAAAGNMNYGYSNVYAAFDVRGYNNIEWESGIAFGSTVANDIRILNEEIPAGRKLTLGFYPLSGDDADYSGMARRYREYLTEKKLLQKSDKEQKNYRLTLIGGTQTKGFFLGIPYDKFLPLTTFGQAEKICAELNAETGVSPVVLLEGYGNSGLNVSEIAGGYEIPKKLGGAKEREKFAESCKNSGAELYTDFDLVHFSKSGGGFNTFTDSARSADYETAHYYPLKKNVRIYNTDLKSIRMLARDKVTKAAERLLKFCGKADITGVGLSSFGECAYSDYKEEKYMVKGGIEEQAAEIITDFKNGGHSVLLSAANAYAAGLSDALINTPTENGDYYALDCSVPFYETVYGGYIPLYGTPLNLSQNFRASLLKAVESGVAPSFTVSFETDKALIKNADFNCGGILYGDNFKTICETVSELKELHEKTVGSAISKHFIMDGGVTKTVFENGAAVYVNHSDAQTEADGLTLPALSFKCGKE